MSKDKDKDKPDSPPKKGKGLLLKIGLGVLLLAAGGGGAFGLLASGIIGTGTNAGPVDNSPKLVKKGGKDPYAVADDKAVQIVHGEGGNQYRTAYFTFEEGFTSNLRNSDALVQVLLATSTQRDGRVLMWLKEHELAIRSQLLIDLADTPEEEVLSPTGKDRLQKRMTASINRILTEAEGFGGVDQVYFRSFIVQ